MLKEDFSAVYSKFELNFFKMIFELVRERDGSLSAMEAFSLQVISILGKPTIGEFADFLNISQSNATYKINSLIKKGYIDRENSSTDHREYHLVLSEKFYNYIGLFTKYQGTVLDRLSERFPPEDIEKFDEILKVMANELMPEIKV